MMSEKQSFAATLFQYAKPICIQSFITYQLKRERLSKLVDFQAYLSYPAGTEISKQLKLLMKGIANMLIHVSTFHILCTRKRKNEITIIQCSPTDTGLS